MNLIWRFIWTLLFSRCKAPVGLFDTCSMPFSVLPTDIDVLMHMNNGRYFSLLDLARINFMLRNNVYPVLKQHHIYPVVASEMIRFKRSLNLFQRFEITTRLLGWDDKYFYIEHYFKHADKICALSLVKARMLRKDGMKVSPAEILDLIGEQRAPLVLPDWVNDWQRAEQTFYATAMQQDECD